MNRGLLAAIACAAAVAALSAAPLTPEQTLDRRSIGELEMSPDGSRLVFTVSEPPKGTARARALWLMEVPGGQLRQLTFSGKSDGSPRWSPDGTSIAFTSDRDGAAQLYRLSLRGGEAEKLTDRKDAVSAFRWSPDGSRIALLMTEAKTDAQQAREKDKDDSRVVDKEDRHARVWVLDLETKALKQVTSGRWQIRQIEWLPAGDRLVAIATSKPDVDQWTDHLYTINLESGDFTEIAAPRGPLSGLALSPDGNTLAYVGARVAGPDAHDVYLQPLAGGAPQNITAATVDRPVTQARWIDDQSLAVNTARGFKSVITSVDRRGKATAVDGIEVNPSSFARSSSGTIVFAGETATRAPELWVKTPNAPARIVSRLNEKWSSMPLVAPEFLKYKSADGKEIEAALLLPASGLPNPRSLIPNPLVVLVHGGPTGRWSDSFEPWGQLLVSRAYAVLYPNV